MEKLQELIKEIYKQKISVSPKGLIKQTERNTLKTDILKAIMQGLPHDIVLGKTNEGICIMVDNENEGGIPIILDIKIKNMNTDLDTAIEEYEEKQAEKRQRAEDRKKEAKASFNNQVAKKKFLADKEKGKA